MNIKKVSKIYRVLKTGVNNYTLVKPWAKDREKDFKVLEKIIK